MRIRKARRPGVTLVEVLAAIFVMGIGMLAVLVLFPLGALRMAAALKDGRCGVIASNADSIATAFDLRNDTAVEPKLKEDYSPGAGYAPADPAGRGYPVFVDPYYAVSGYANVGASAIPRVSPTFANTQPLAERWFTFLDDMTFEANGYPKVAGGSLERQWKYTWAYLLKRYRSNDPDTTELWVVAYRSRPTATPSLEETYSVAGPTSLGDTSVVVQWPASQEKPALRRGGWVLDTTYKTRPAGGVARGYMHAEFYKVLETTDEGANQMRLDIQPPLRDSGVAQLVVLEGAAEVFERGNGKK